MRQLAVLESEVSARKLTAYLMLERIAAHFEVEQAGFVIWVRDEDQLALAKEILAQFQQAPDAPKFQGAEKSAESMRREDERRRREKASNVVEMRGRWGSGGIKKRCPAVLAMIALSILVAIFTHAGEQTNGTVMKGLLFVDPALLSEPAAVPPPHYGSSILAGQVWRLVTPIFIHFGLTHLIFNMMWLFILGGQIEDRRGTLRFLILAFVLAIACNLGEAVIAQTRLPAVVSLCGGMSGVGYGMFGYVWMKVKFDHSSGFTLSRESVFIMVVWFALCILRDFPPFDAYLSGLIRGSVGNTAHVVGLFLGLAIGYAPVMLRRK